MLPLTSANVTTLFNTGILTKAGVDSSKPFHKLLKIPLDLINNPPKAAEWWVENGKPRQWRYIIFCLDYIGETDKADELMQYSEQPSGV